VIKTQNHSNFQKTRLLVTSFLQHFYTSKGDFESLKECKDVVSVDIDFGTIWEFVRISQVSFSHSSFFVIGEILNEIKSAPG
jgi:hypothetical protein